MRTNLLIFTLVFNFFQMSMAQDLPPVPTEIPIPTGIPIVTQLPTLVPTPIEPVSTVVPEPAAPVETIVKPIYSSKDWKLEMEISAEHPNGVCIASTKGKLEENFYNLKLVVDLTYQRPLEIYIVSDSSNTTIQGILTNLNSVKKINVGFAKSQASTDGNEQFLFIPGLTDEMLKTIKRAVRIDMQVAFNVDSLKPLIFSLRGSSAVLDSLKEKCSPSLPLAPVEFENLFLPDFFLDTLAHPLTPTLVEELREYIKTAYIAFADNKITHTSIEKLNHQYAKQLHEYADVQSNIDNLTKGQLAKLLAKETAAKELIEKLQGEIVDFQEQIKVKEAEQAIANTDYEIAYNKFNPLIPEHKRFSEIYSNSVTQKNQVQRDLSDIDANIAQERTNIANLKSEDTYLQSQLIEANRNLDNSRMLEAQAESQLRAFDYNYEVRRQTDQDSRINDLERQSSYLREQSNQAENNVRQAERGRNAADIALQVCQRGPAILSAIETVDLNAGPRPPQPDPGPVNPPPTAPRDCSAEQRNAEQAQRNLNHTVQYARQIRNDLVNIHQQKQERVREIEYAVAQQRENLVAREAQANQRLAEDTNIVNQISFRLHQIETSELPSAQQALASLQKRKPDVISRLENAKANMHKAEVDLNSYDQTVQYKELKQNLADVIALMAQIKTDLRKMDSNIKQRLLGIKEQQGYLVIYQKQIDKITDKIRQNQTRTAELDQILIPYREAQEILTAQVLSNDLIISESKTEVDKITNF